MEQCGQCCRLELEYDDARREYHPYCWEYEAWNEDVKFFGGSLRNNICLAHGRPELIDMMGAK